MARRKPNVQQIEGKTLSQWQQEVNEFCKDTDSRRCKQTNAATAAALHPLNITNLLTNYRCYVARWATFQFYESDGPADTVYQNHRKAIDNAWKAVEDCLRFIEQEYQRRENVAQKEKNKRKAEEEQKRAAAKKPRVPPVKTADGLSMDPLSQLDENMTLAEALVVLRNVRKLL